MRRIRGREKVPAGMAARVPGWGSKVISLSSEDAGLLRTPGSTAPGFFLYGIPVLFPPTGRRGPVRLPWGGSAASIFTAGCGGGAGSRSKGRHPALRGAGSAICFPRPFSLSIRHRLESFLLPRVPHRRQGDGGFSRGFDWHHDFLIRRIRWVSEDLHFSPSAEKEWILKER